MRNLNADRNVASIEDGISGDTHEIYYRRPTVKEMVSYQSGLFERKGQKILNRSTETRLKFGTKIITGFAKGTIGIDGKPFSSDSTDPDYRDDWKDLLVEYAPDVVILVALAAFEGTGIAAPKDEDSSPLA